MTFLDINIDTMLMSKAHYNILLHFESESIKCQNLNNTNQNENNTVNKIGKVYHKLYC